MRRRAFAPACKAIVEGDYEAFQFKLFKNLEESAKNISACEPS